MRLPNSYGSIYKLSGNRRRPFAAVITQGWKDDGKPIRKYLGYYTTRKDALSALADYNAKPYKIDDHGITLAALYARWTAYRQERNKSIPQNYKAAYKRMEPLYSVPFVDITTFQWQDLVDSCPKAPSARLIKVLANLLYKYAALLDITTDNRVTQVETPVIAQSTKHRPFSHDEIKELWNHKDDFAARYALIMCYTGMRPTEVIKIKNQDVHIDEHYMVGGIKTAAGMNRQIPIADKIMPFIEQMYSPEREYLLVNEHGLHPQTLQFLRKHYWDISDIPAIKNHFPHDGRHTCETALDNARISKKIIQLIIGHAGRDIDERVYTHKTTQQLIDAINKI